MKGSLTEAMVRQHATPEVFRRGEDYLARGAVLSLLRRGDVLLAEVEGSDYAPYRVSITSGAGGEIAAECSCPYGAEWGGWCKHIVAALLTMMRTPNTIEEQPPLAKLLAKLNREQLESLLLGLAEADPGLYDLIAARITLLEARASTTASPAPGRGCQGGPPPGPHRTAQPRRDAPLRSVLARGQCSERGATHA